MDAEFERFVEDALRETATPGCAVALAVQGETWMSGFGAANTQTGLPFAPDSRVPICSMTKPYTATVMMALVEQGKVELDAPVRRYLPGFRVHDQDASERVTIRQLLDHTSGWVGDLEEEDAERFDRGESAVAEQVARMATLRQVSPPGESWSYSNSGFVVAGRVIEVVCDAPYELVAKRMLLDPLCMGESTFFVELMVTCPIAVGHAAGPDGFEVIPWPWVCERRISPAGGVISNAIDQLRWVRWWAGDPSEGATDPISAKTRELMLRETVPAGNVCDLMGIGWMIDEVEGAKVVHHGGTGFGIQTLGAFVAEAQLALVVLSNARGGLVLQKRIRDYVLGRYAGVRVPTYQPLEVPRARLAEYAGTYSRLGVDGDLSLEVRDSDGGLCVIAPQDEGEPPTQVDVSLFREDEAVVLTGDLEGLRTEFLRDESGGLHALRFGGRTWLRERAPAPDG
jgi:CubicO group peptidase (beta-lactamase class C family)